MSQPIVSIVEYVEPFRSVQQAVTLCRGLERLSSGDSVVIKPNIVFWTTKVRFPKWGVITTSRVVEDTVRLLKDLGVKSIAIVEGIVTRDPKDRQTAAHAFDYLGYTTLTKRYGVQCYNAMDRPFTRVDLGEDLQLRINRDMLECDFAVNLPCLKTHQQTVVSLGMKNLKGLLDIPSRKKCHRAGSKRNLDWMIARLPHCMPPMLTLIDGIYSLERGPAFDGKMHRTNCLLASNDPLAADMAGAKVLGYDPGQVPHLVQAAQNQQRPADGTWISLRGKPLEAVSRFHEHAIAYTSGPDGEMPLPLARDGIKGLFYRQFDQSLCTYCSVLNGLLLTAIRLAWKGTPWPAVEVLTGKSMQPTPGMQATILLGRCMYRAHRQNPCIQTMLPVKGCPPDPLEAMRALQQAGIAVEASLFLHMDELPGMFLERYQDRPEFEESFFQIS